MTLAEAKANIKLFRSRRGHLKAALRKDAKFFDMTLWFQGNYSLATRLEIDFLDTSVKDKIDSSERKRIFKQFEACGTSCCIAGLDFMRSGRKLKEIVSFYNFEPKVPGFIENDSYLFFESDWPNDIKTKYYDAKDKKDHAGMAEAGCEAIDYFGQQGDKLLLARAA